MMENKPRIAIYRLVGMSEKSPPPGKLLLNHGKPNFTIVKSPKPKSNSVPDEREFFGASDLKPIALNKRVPKSPLQNGSENEAPNDDEFMRLHKKIGGRNIDEIINNNNNNIEDDIKQNGHYNNAAVKLNGLKDPQFATVQRNCILSLKSISAENSNDGITLNTQVEQMNGKVSLLEKPQTPEKPNNLKLLDRNTSVSSPPPQLVQQQKQAFNQLSPQVPQTANQGGANFEQRTVVSFAKDLSVMPNRYPDTVKITKPTENGGTGRALPKEFGELKFEIASNGDVMMPMKKSLA